MFCGILQFSKKTMQISCTQTFLTWSIFEVLCVYWFLLVFFYIWPFLLWRSCEPLANSPIKVSPKEQVTLSNSAIVIYFLHLPEASNNVILKLGTRFFLRVPLCWGSIVVQPRVVVKRVSRCCGGRSAPPAYFVIPLSTHTHHTVVSSFLVASFLFIPLPRGLYSSLYQKNPID